MNKEEFDKYVSDGYTQIPVYEEFVADLISPLYVFSNYFNLKNTFLSGLHFLIPIIVLIYLLVYLRFTASYSIFYATVTLIFVNLINKIIKQSNFIAQV